MAGKRKAAAAPATEDAELGLVAQKQKTGEGSSAALAVAQPSLRQKFKPGAHQRTSSLDAPIMLLEGHEDAVTCVEFSPDGATVATAGADKTLHLWNVRGECEVRPTRRASIDRERAFLFARRPRGGSRPIRTSTSHHPRLAIPAPTHPRPAARSPPRPIHPRKNFMMCRGHKNAILDLRWTADGDDLVTCSPDATLRLWDAATGQQTKTMKGHKGFVNACDVSRRAGDHAVVSGSDDRTWKLWDMRVSGRVPVMSAHDGFPVTAVAFGADAYSVFTGGVGEVAKRWDARAMSGSVSDDVASRNAVPAMTLRGHADTITGMRLSPDGTHLLTNGADSSLRVWDVRPYCEGDRCERTMAGHAHGFEKALLRCAWSPDGARVAAGSSCRNVFVWDASSGKVEYKLPGHLGTVHAVAFHPSEPILGSAGADRRVFLGELAE